MPKHVHGPTFHHRAAAEQARPNILTITVTLVAMKIPTVQLITLDTGTALTSSFYDVNAVSVQPRLFDLPS